jgi:two-component system, NarL family, nitrate/nitrite response regulator NarL
MAVVDRHRLFTDCLRAAFADADSDLSVVLTHDGRDVSGEELSLVLSGPSVDVVLIGLDPGAHLDGLAVVGAVTRSGRPVIVLADEPASADDLFRGLCLLHGARAVLSRNTPLTSLVALVRSVLAGEDLVPADERDRLVALAQREGHRVRMSQLARERLARLSAQEAETLRHLMCGRTVREIARMRVVSEATVRTQVKMVLRKLEASSQVSAVSTAFRAGWKTAC